jgi:DNA-binding MarR family transcriptional regulator
VTLTRQLALAEHALTSVKADALRALDLTLPQHTALEALLRDEGQSCTQLAREALVTSQTMTGVLRNLEEKRLVSRSTSPVHARVSLYSLTPEGRRVAERAEKIAGAVDRRLAAAFSDAEREQLADLLGRAAGALREVSVRPTR